MGCTRFPNQIIMLPPSNKAELDPVNKRIILQPFNIDFSVEIIDEFQSLETFLIGVLALQLRIFIDD